MHAPMRMKADADAVTHAHARMLTDERGSSEIDRIRKSGEMTLSEKGKVNKRVCKISRDLVHVYHYKW